MDILRREINPALNKFIRENPSLVKDVWDDLVCQYSYCFNEETLSLLEPLRDEIPTLFDDIASYTCLPVAWARKYEKYVSSPNWRGMLHQCETDEDFEWVASHLESLPEWIRSCDTGRKFSHLLSKYTIE